MGEGEMVVTWEYLSTRGTLRIPDENDPIKKECIAVSLRHAMKIAYNLKVDHGKNLLFVDVKMRIV